MKNLFETIKANPVRYRQLSCNELLVSEFKCSIQTVLEDMWTEHNYFVYVFEGRKIWHTAQATYDLQAGDCIFVRKGACIVERFADSDVCVIVFFVPDEFIRDTLRLNDQANIKPGKFFDPIMRVETDETLYAFFQSMLPYFTKQGPPDSSLLELKFRELLLNVIGNYENRDVLSYFSSLLNEPSSISLRKIMEDNYCYNLSMDEFARLCNRSLSAFKRDFQKIYDTSPGKWLISKRLAHARLLLSNSEKSVSDIAFECGFENLSHFSRVFRQVYQVNPLSFRRKVLA